MKKQDRTAIEVVAQRFSARWEDRSDPSEAYLVVAGKRIAVDIATLKQSHTGQGEAAKLRLRFDKVATRLIERLQTSVGEHVPNGVTVLLTITAPIRLPSKTAAALEDKIQTVLGRGSASRDDQDTIYGNRVRVRMLREKAQLAPRMIGFVHNSDSDPHLLLNITGELLELISVNSSKRAARVAGDRWLVIRSGEISYLDAYRHVCSQLRMPPDLKKILVVFEDGRVEELT
ncbi:MAG: hypothetical protein JO097_06420 [Acidobacteriaceae bacterium]|nr:hypothetical protein [Acidobacteriaceae bacterium]MBV9295201.1 hypothetical protein [Acidobacteriaceae bacterium]MBV9767715.1 hypothetical protein [Acidobacteriaceae bacterium]